VAYTDADYHENIFLSKISNNIQLVWIKIEISNNTNPTRTITYPNSFTMYRPIGVISQNGDNSQLSIDVGNSSVWFKAQGSDTRNITYYLIVVGY